MNLRLGGKNKVLPFSSGNDCITTFRGDLHELFEARKPVTALLSLTRGTYLLRIDDRTAVLATGFISGSMKKCQNPPALWAGGVQFFKIVKSSCSMRFELEIKSTSAIFPSFIVN